VNRGIEDGLVKGDHAKFYVSSGVVARGVCIKVSPTRSVWAVYRVVNATFIADDQVMKLKITPAVKITKDESRMLVSDDSRLRPRDPRDLGIPLAEGADDLRINELTPTPESEKVNFNLEATSLLERNKEIFGMLHYSSHRETASPDDNTADFTADITNILFKFGGEWYFPAESTWYHRISFSGVFVMDRRSTMSHLGTVLKDESNEFGLGASLNLFEFPSATYRFIHYVNYTFSLGASTVSYESGAEVGTSISNSVDGSVQNHVFGYGLKYYTPSGFGMRMEFSYVQRGDIFGTSNTSNTSYIKTRQGPTLQAGLGYRF
jgi:hypothetical protein